MKKLLKPVCLLFNILIFILFFFIGLLYAGWIEAGKGQGLAAGAIVLGYGVIFALVAMLISFFLTYRLEHKYVVRGNVIALVLILTCVLVIKLNADKRHKERNTEHQEEISKPTEPLKRNGLIALATIPEKQFQKTSIGIGFFKPEWNEKTPIYFYGNPNLEKSIQEHQPIDSIVFSRNERGLEITYAPPWLMPEHLKLDYGILLFRVLFIGEEFVQVEGNRNNGYSMYMSRRSGNTISWPEFLLGVNSVEFINPSEQKIRIKPLNNATEVKVPHEFMKPILVNENWARVALFDTNYEKIGEGWIEWKKDGQLQISYYLLS